MMRHCRQELVGGRALTAVQHLMGSGFCEDCLLVLTDPVRLNDPIFSLHAPF